MNLNEIFTYPYDDDFILRKRKALRRELLARDGVNYIDKRIAILGGSTTFEIKNLLEVFLLKAGIRPTFYESDYNKFYEDAIFSNAALDEFNPEVIILFTNSFNIINRPNFNDTAADVERKLDEEFSRFKNMWESLTRRFSAVIIQNNFEMTWCNILGNLDAVSNFGMARYISTLNEKFAVYAETHKNFYIHDINRLSAQIGLNKWHNRLEYCSYKFAMSLEVMPQVANNLANIVKAIFGLSKKCLVLDLDNTIWGGIIAEDGVENLQIGHETPTAEMFTEFQNYVLDLKRRGIILAVCSKNDEEVAKRGFTHPDSILKLSDFAAFYANMKPKSENILNIARDLNIGVDSLVFIDDNSFERQLVRDILPEVSVPEVDAGNCYSYIRAIEDAGYFETVSISSDDLKRAETYSANSKRREMQLSASSYEDYLQSLEMVAEIAPFKEIYFDRIAQLTNKTNQFNLTTRRFSRADIQNFADNPNYITLYCRLKDKLGDNGLISVVVAERKGDELDILLWLMSCRVLNRGVEYVLMDSLIERVKSLGVKKIRGFYFKTEKNKLVANFYEDFGFEKISQTNDDKVFSLNVSDYVPRGKFIQTVEVIQ